MNSLLPKVECQSYLATYTPMGSEIRIPVTHYCSSYIYIYFKPGNMKLIKFKTVIKGIEVFDCWAAITRFLTNMYIIVIINIEKFSLELLWQSQNSELTEKINYSQSRGKRK